MGSIPASSATVVYEGAADEAELNKYIKKKNSPVNFLNGKETPEKAGEQQILLLSLKKNRANSNDSQFPVTNKKYKYEILFLWVRW